MDRQLKRLQKAHNGIQYIVSQQTREELSPFVFFDAGTMHRKDDGMHPHSGIGIITYFEGGELVHDDSGNNADTIKDGGVQWIQAGGGIWHEENYRKKRDEPSEVWMLGIHQLWLQLPETLEEAKPSYENVQPEQLPKVGNVKVVIGTYQEAVSPLRIPFNLTYLDVTLEKGQGFVFETPEGQTKGFVFPRSGSVKLGDDEIPTGHMGILTDDSGTLRLKGLEPSKFVVVLSAPQDLSMVTHHGSVHTSMSAMLRSQERIRESIPKEKI